MDICSDPNSPVKFALNSNASFLQSKAMLPVALESLLSQAHRRSSSNTPTTPPLPQYPPLPSEPAPMAAPAWKPPLPPGSAPTWPPLPSTPLPVHSPVPPPSPQSTSSYLQTTHRRRTPPSQPPVPYAWSPSTSSPGFSPTPVMSPPTPQPPPLPQSNDSTAVVADFLHKILPTPHPSVLPDWVEQICHRIGEMTGTLSPEVRSAELSRLRRHLGVGKDSQLYSCTLVAIGILKVSPNVVERRVTQDVRCNIPEAIHRNLSIGRFVPIEHVLYGECIMAGYVNVSDDRHKYPLNLVKEMPPKSFIDELARLDILRGMMTHAMCLGQRFPELSADMHSLNHQMWVLLFTDRLPLHSAMYLYNCFFTEFERTLCSLKVLPLNRFPQNLLDAAWAHARNHNDSPNKRMRV